MMAIHRSGLGLEHQGHAAPRPCHTVFNGWGATTAADAGDNDGREQ
jgi:hypothetical protein